MLITYYYVCVARVGDLLLVPARDTLEKDKEKEQTPREEKWKTVTRVLLRIARLKRIWAALGHHLRYLKSLKN